MNHCEKYSNITRRLCRAAVHSSYTKIMYIASRSVIPLNHESALTEAYFINQKINLPAGKVGDRRAKAQVM